MQLSGKKLKQIFSKKNIYGEIFIRYIFIQKNLEKGSEISDIEFPKALSAGHSGPPTRRVRADGPGLREKRLQNVCHPLRCF